MSARRPKAGTAADNPLVADLQAELDERGRDRQLRHAAAVNSLDIARFGLRGLSGLLRESEDPPAGFEIAAMIEALADQLDPVAGELLVPIDG